MPTYITWGDLKRYCAEQNVPDSAIIRISNEDDWRFVPEQIPASRLERAIEVAVTPALITLVIVHGNGYLRDLQ